MASYRVNSQSWSRIARAGSMCSGTFRRVNYTCRSISNSSPSLAASLKRKPGSDLRESGERGGHEVQGHPKPKSDETNSCGAICRQYSHVWMYNIWVESHGNSFSKSDVCVARGVRVPHDLDMLKSGDEHRGKAVVRQCPMR